MVPSIAERISPRVELRLAGRVWRLLVTYGVLLDCEGASGIDMVKAAEVERPSARLTQCLLWAMLKRAGAPFALKQAGRLITPATLASVLAANDRAWIASMAASESRKARRGADAIPTPRKKLSWIEYWATAHQALRLSEAEWLAMTPRIFAALETKWMEGQQHREYLASTIASTTANHSACRPQQPFPLDHFMPHPLDQEEQGPITGEYISGQLGGRIFKQQHSDRLN